MGSEHVCVCVSIQSVCVPWSPGEPLALEKHKQHCPLWHRRRPHSSEKHREHLSKTEFWCSRLNLSANLRNDNVKQTSDRRPRATITAAAPHRAAFVSNGQIYRKNNPGGEGVAFESVTRFLQSLSFFSLCSCFVFCTLSHTHTSAHTNSCMLGNVVLFLVARSPALMLYI